MNLSITSIKRTILSLLQNRYEYPLGTDLKGKVVMVTGASRGIGLDVAQFLYARGCSIIAVSNSKTELVNAFKNNNVSNVLSLVADVGVEKDVKNLIKKSISRFGHIDVLINNAGIYRGGLLENMSLVNFNQLIAVNLLGVFLMTKECLPYMKARRYGTIINMGSKISSNNRPAPGSTVYAMTKYGIEGFSKALKTEVEKFNIRVSCIMPGTVNSYLSIDSANHLSPLRIAEIIYLIIVLDEVSFDSIVLQSIHQHL